METTSIHYVRLASADAVLELAAGRKRLSGGMGVRGGRSTPGYLFEEEMKGRFTPHLVDLTFEAALRSFWRKSALSRFLQRSEIASLPPWLPEESKRDYLHRVFELLRGTDRGKAKILQLAQFLGDQATVPDLQGWEDAVEKLESARSAVTALKSYLNEQEQSLLSEEQRQEARRRLREAQAGREQHSSLSGPSQRHWRNCLLRSEVQMPDAHSRAGCTL